jgi:acetyl esterase
MRRWLDMIAARQSPRRVVLDFGLHALAGAADWLPAMRERRAGTRLIEDLPYAHHAGQAQCLDLHIPAGTGPHPVLIYLHGGAFAMASKRTHRALAEAYAAHGWLVCNVDYRLAPQFPYPAAAEDACAAWAWVVREIGCHGGDAQRIVLAGESAGANLALVVALACATPRPEPWAAPLHAAPQRPAALLLYYGFLQASEPQRYRRAGVSGLAAHVAEDAARSYLGATAARHDPSRALADPLCVIEGMTAAPGLPPSFIACGDTDPCAPDSQRLAAALQRLGEPHALQWYPGESHGFHVMFWRAQAQRCWRDSFAFLQSVQRHPADLMGGVTARPDPGPSDAARSAT